ncbi:MAG TPA: phosphoribosyltransferase family protein [Candidatus Eisenbacteria bacterium]|nr:phosphoribosyltransferase family protein [Candidatus Eisenbacteria bacterium]
MELDPRRATASARRHAEAFARDWLDAITDRRCPGCGGGIAREEFVCAACDGEVGRLGATLCLRCLRGDDPVSDGDAAGGGCPRHGSSRLLLAGPAYERPLDAIIRAFKYEGESHLAPWLASLVPSIPATFSPFPSPDSGPPAAFLREALLVPAALDPARRASRGFDQALLLAESLGRWWGVPVAALLERTREAPPQAHLAPDRRRVNVEGAYRIRAGDASLLRGRPILLVDDVATTGATLLAAADALESGRPGWILALSVSHGGASGDPGEGAQSTANAKVAAPGVVW